MREPKAGSTEGVVGEAVFCLGFVATARALN